MDAHKGVNLGGNASFGGSPQRCIIATCLLEAHRTWHVVAPTHASPMPQAHAWLAATPQLGSWRPGPISLVPRHCLL